ncbi:MAG: hypothetical protein HPY74_13535 [Firmicutes bacterium]|nr:hypothetical protein [Bacillota bacterium]
MASSNNLPNNQLEELIRELKTIKDTIRKSNSIWKYVYVSSAMRTVWLAAGIFATLISGAFYLAINKYGSYNAVPAGLKWVLYIFLSLFILIIGAMKILRIMKSVRKVKSDATLYNLIDEIYTARTIPVMLSFLIAIILSLVFLSYREIPQYIPSILAILFGLLCNAFMNIFYLDELPVCGDWLLLTGFLSLFLSNTINPLLAVIITFGAGFILTYFASLFFTKKKVDSDG